MTRRRRLPPDKMIALLRDGNVSEFFEVVMQQLRSLRIIQGPDFIRLARFESSERSIKLSGSITTSLSTS